MLDERPSAAELVNAVADFLEQDLPAAALDPQVAFHTRIAVNVLRIVERELAAGAEVAAADRTRVSALTGSDADLPTLNSVLAEHIRTGRLSTEDEALRDHLIRSALSRLAIDNPRYPSLREAPGHWPDVH